MSSFRTCPTPNPGVSRMEFDYYYNGEEEAFEKYLKFVRQVALEDFELCVATQKNLQKGVYCEGILNPVKESGVICEASPRLLLTSEIFCSNAKRFTLYRLSATCQETCTRPI